MQQVYGDKEKCRSDGHHVDWIHGDRTSPPVRSLWVSSVKCESLLLFDHFFFKTLILHTITTTGQYHDNLLYFVVLSKCQIKRFNHPGILQCLKWTCLTKVSKHLWQYSHLSSRQIQQHTSLHNMCPYMQMTHVQPHIWRDTHAWTYSHKHTIIKA